MKTKIQIIVKYFRVARDFFCIHENLKATSYA